MIGKKFVRPKMSRMCLFFVVKSGRVIKGGMAVPELGDAQRGREAGCGHWQRPHMPIIKSEVLELI